MQTPKPPAHAEELLKRYPAAQPVAQLRETAWFNPGLLPTAEALENCRFSLADVEDAAARWQRFAPYLAAAFPETAGAGGIVESPLREAPAMQNFLGGLGGHEFAGRMLVKCDSHLPVSGSIKARGGFYEVLCHAERLALEHGVLRPGEGYGKLAGGEARALFRQHAIAVGSTGNLGLSIGIMSAQLGFKVTVHMSADARSWKKQMLLARGAEVVEHRDDYSRAVKEGRKQAGGDCYFVDDENSATLFLGYAVAALRLKGQLAAMGITPDAQHPLFVYLPCGVGGGPGGVAFGLRLVFGDAVHPFFAEPTQAPCMMLGLLTGLHDGISVQDIGLTGRTCADGLAVGRPSRFVGRTIAPFLSGCFTVSDERMLYLLEELGTREGLWLEPSALAGFRGPEVLLGTEAGRAYIQRQGLQNHMQNAVHMPWATGGSMVPPNVLAAYREKGRAAAAQFLQQEETP